MIYNDGPNMDSDLRIVECPRCKNSQFDDDAIFCQVCGLSLYNYCEGREEYDEQGNYIGMGKKHKNLGNARFCKYCGARTQYFLEDIILDFSKTEPEPEPFEEPEDIPW